MVDEESKRVPNIAPGNEVGLSQASLREEIEAEEVQDRQVILERVEKRRQLAKMLVNTSEGGGGRAASAASSGGNNNNSNRGKSASAAAAAVVGGGRGGAQISEMQGREKLDFLLK